GAEQGRVLAAVGWQPTSLSVIVERTGSTVSAVSRNLATLEDAGLVRSDGGWWSRVPGSPRDEAR
ncbi:MAG: MarR family transcriptional regulator, partial [Pseudonocardiaceae bacterium]